MNAVTVRAIDAYLNVTARDPAPWLFKDRTGTRRLAYSTAFQLVQRLARQAEIAAAADITPHSFRHMFATEALAAGVPLQDVQDALGHADPRTTRRYDQSRQLLDRHPTHLMVTHLSHRPAEQ